MCAECELQRNAAHVERKNIDARLGAGTGEVGLDDVCKERFAGNNQRDNKNGSSRKGSSRKPEGTRPSLRCRLAHGARLSPVSDSSSSRGIGVNLVGKRAAHRGFTQGNS